MATSGTFRVWYATREEVMRAADIKAAAYQSAEIDRALDSASLAVDSLCHRGDATHSGFAPWTGVRLFDWPDSPNNSGSYRFWLNQHALLSATAVTSGAVAITANVLLEPASSGPPYSSLNVDRGSASVLGIGPGSGQRSLSITGVWGYTLAERTLTNWTLTTTVNASISTVVMAAPLGVGSVIRLDTERMVVTDRAWATSAQTGSLTSSQVAQTLAVADGTQFLAGEELLLDAERVLVQDISGNNLIVKRAVAGTVLAAHTTATIYWSRSFTVDRGALGTTAASHTAAAAVYVWQPPALVKQLTIAYALDQRLQETTAYARTAGQGDGEFAVGGRGIRDLEDRVRFAHGRNARIRAVA